MAELIKVVEQLKFVKNYGNPKSIPSRGYYVYVITENETICYIGKGKRYRVLDHFKDSSNQLLGSKIKDNKNIFNWYVLECFDYESDSLNYEEELIIDCKSNKHKLYNKIHYSSDIRYNSDIRIIFTILNQFEKMTFLEINNVNIVNIEERINILFDSINCICKKLAEIPTYKGKDINNLSYNIYRNGDIIKAEIY